MLTIEQICEELNKKQADRVYSPDDYRKMTSQEAELAKVQRLLWAKLCELEAQTAGK